MNQIRMTLAALVCCIMAAQAQTEEFTVATLNVDGLPQKLIIPVNPDGPGEKYTPEIADFLLNKKYDIIGVQENFNYYDYLFPKLDAAGYSHDRCYSKIELENFRYPYPNDGINAIWRKGIKGERTDSVAWTESYGIISHANDGLTNKGFRRYELTLAAGQQIVVYNMHMDAGDVADEREGKDSLDHDARLMQWDQLRDDILNRLDKRSVIIVGNTNCYYSRDQIKSKFIDVIEATGRATVSDAWVELQNGGKYPDFVSSTVNCEAEGNILESGEVPDKVLYVNPTDGTGIHAVSYQLDTMGYRHDGKVLGDHYPVSVTFQAGKPDPSGIDAIDNGQQTAGNEFYNLNGQRVNGSTHGIVIERNRDKSHKRIIK